MTYAEVVFNLPVNHPFTYKIPGELQFIEPGYRVLAPFGKRILTGVFIRRVPKPVFRNIRNLIDTPDEKPLISPGMLELTRWMSEYYMCSWGQALQVALPKGSDRRVEDYLDLGKESDDSGLTTRQSELYLLIGSDPGKSKDFYRRKLGKASFYSSLRVLHEKKLIRIETRDKKGRVKSLYRQFVHVPEDYHSIKGEFPDFIRYIRKKPHVDKLMGALAGKQMLRSEFLEETRMAVATLRKMTDLGVCELKELPVERRPQFRYQESQKDITLTKHQKAVIGKIIASYNKQRYGSFLLHGVTGSGKTQVYIEVLKTVLKKGQNAIILIPEIALTPQTVSRFQAVFGDNAAVFHSRMSQGERHDAWMSCVEGRVRIVIGPRSALFVPLSNIGLIVVDEEHESSYKQTDAQPRYHARDVALYWARMNEAQIILGSATPSLESYYNAQLGKHTLLEIPERVNNISLPEVTLVDARSLRANRTSSIFSPLLIEKIETRLARKEQVILLQNRRGHASFLQCTRCGYIALCPHCELSLTYHSYDETVRCHFCGYKEAPAPFCPGCGGEQIRYTGAGTQKIEQEIGRLFSGARVLRMDLDTTRGKNMYDRILQAFGNREADILLGTQMVAKGLDFPTVTLVGVISADIGLSVPDFRAAERVFQLMMQVAGRSGRSRVKGEVIIQCMNMTHYAIQLARKHDFEAFFKQELTHRRSFSYPPFSRLLKVLVTTDSLHEAISLTRVVSSQIRGQLPQGSTLVGPAPDLYPKLNNQYRWQINIKLPPYDQSVRRRVKKAILEIISPYLVKPKKGMQIQVDVDPFSI